MKLRDLPEATPSTCCSLTNSCSLELWFSHRFWRNLSILNTNSF